MELEIKIKGIRPIIMHSGEGINTRHPANIEKAKITARKGKDRTEADDARLAELECFISLWLDGETPTIPGKAIRACIETSAKTLSQGQKVRRGLGVLESSFAYDMERYGTTLDELIKTTQFQSIVSNPSGRGRLIRTRAMFDTPWTCDFRLDVYDDLVDRTMLEQWLEFGGRCIGLGDWRPDKSGDYGRFEVESLKPVE